MIPRLFELTIVTIYGSTKFIYPFIGINVISVQENIPYFLVSNFLSLFPMSSKPLIDQTLQYFLPAFLFYFGFVD